MNIRLCRASLVLLSLTLTPGLAGAQNAPRRVAACSILPKAEVRRHLPWNDIVDRIPPEEEQMGLAGSACEYPSVRIQVSPVQRLVRGVPSTQPGWQAVSGVGDEAWFRANGKEYGELYVKTATHTLTLQADAKGNPAAVKPGTIALANALLAKLKP